MSNRILRMENIPSKLYDLGEHKFLKKDDILIHSGEETDYFYILVKGSILLISYTMDGASVYNFLLVPPATICEVHSMFNIEVEPTIKCLDNVEVIKISRNTILNLLQTDVDVTKYMQNIICFYLKTMSHQAINYASFSSEKQITDIFIEFAEVLGEEVDGKIKINYKITQQFISSFTGVKRITTYRIFEKLKEKNFLEFFKGYYYIKNLQLLKQYSEKL